LALAAFAVNFGGIASTAANPPDPPAASAEPDLTPRNIRLGPGDGVTLSVFGQPDMSNTSFVADDGTLTVPLAGPVQVSGLSPADAARRIAKALRDGKFILDPQVTISAIETRNQRISVIGEVNRPGRYPIESNIDIVDLLAEAGGVTENASDIVYLLRGNKDGKETRYEIDLRSLTKGIRPGVAQTLQGGDSLFVPRAEQFYIYGEVAMPGKFRIEPGMTVVQAIARAGGLTPRGSQRRVEIKRELDGGSYATSKAALDELVHANDVIRVKQTLF
jgi:polysaccharide export outer membrane protein